ncbi:MAG: hypothetical protein AUI14_17650 [Actinobacteria bacterium 13_2_20CM_2_71_6]|nr:MAG: hypothetical protein AUI14_17650 [Actinobacteria bacterium 13_2_20CM_2_71_6]
MDETRQVRTGPVPVVAGDYGGSGRDVLLLPGGGRTRRDWDTFAGLLHESGYRPVALDLRGHGESGAAPWSWPGALADVSAVVDELHLDRPVVIGHSLGGMVAALWATQHDDCPLAVNVDGHGNPTRADQFLGADGAAVARQSLITFLGNAVEELPDALAQLMSEVHALDLFAVYRAARCPLLVVSGVAEGSALFLPEHLQAAWEAYRVWVWRELDTVAREVPLVSVASLPTGHDVHREDPQGLLRLVVSHLPEGG